MSNRRQFIHKAGLLTAAALCAPELLQARRLRPAQMGLQLYTLRSILEQEMDSTLKRVADTGYRKVELYGYNKGMYFGKSAAEVKTLLKTYGLNPVSGHYLAGMGGKSLAVEGTLVKGWERAVDDAKSMGHKYMVVAYLYEEERRSLDDYRRLADLLNRCAERCQKAGIQLCYHNHEFEFQVMEGRMPYDLLLGATDPDLLKMELDLYWIHYAGQEPVRYFEEHPGRFPLWHVKDIAKSPQREFCEVGHGSINFPAIFAHAATSGLRHFFVEQDKSSRDFFESIRMSYDYLMKMSY